MFSLEASHRDDSNEYTQHTIINIKRKSPEHIPKSIMSAVMGFICYELTKEFEIAVVNELSVFESLIQKFYCIAFVAVKPDWQFMTSQQTFKEHSLTYTDTL